MDALHSAGSSSRALSMLGMRGQESWVSSRAEDSVGPQRSSRSTRGGDAVCPQRSSKSQCSHYEQFANPFSVSRDERAFCTPRSPQHQAPLAAAEGLLDNLGKGQARMEQELGAIRSDLAHIQELLWHGCASPRAGDAAVVQAETFQERARSQWSRVTELLAGGAPGTPDGAVPEETRGELPEEFSVVPYGAMRHRPIFEAEAVEEENEGSEDNPELLLEEEDMQEVEVKAEKSGEKCEFSHFASSSSRLLANALPPSLPKDWPTSIEGRDVAVGEAQFTEHYHLPGAKLRSQKTATLVLEETASRWVLDPNSNISLMLAAFTLLVLCHDMYMVPFVLAWELPLEGLIMTSAWASCLYWTFDMFMGFISGYNTGHEVELRFMRLIRHYATTWFIPDLVVVLADWFSLVVALQGRELVDRRGAGSFGKLFRFAKLGKLVRLLGLLRMTKVVQLFEEFIENSLSDHTRISLRLLQFLLGITWLCHLICCSWFAVGRAESDTGMRWIDYNTSQGAVELPFMEAGILYQYVTALHWSLAQFSLGAIEITCFNSLERIFNMMCMFIGLIGGSVIVGTFSATMMDYQMVRKENAQKLSRLRRYLRENRKSITKQTAQKVQQQATERLKVREKLQERDVHVLNLVSTTLRSELRFEIVQPLLNTHGLFQMWSMLDRSTIKRACSEHIEFQYYRPQDEIFVAGVVSDRAYHIAAGEVVYVKDPETSPVPEQEIIDVEQGTWLSEAGLWSLWMHVGTAKTVGRCDVLTVTASVVDVMVEHHPQVGSITRHYAKRYLRCISESLPPENAYPDDLEVPHTQFDEIVMCSPPSVQRAVSLHLIDQAATRPGGFKQLREEIRQGKCCIVLTKEGKIQRMVSVVVLNLTDNDGRILVEVGKLGSEDGGDERRFQPSCQLPAKKQAQGEVSMDTVQRILDRLAPLGGPAGRLEMTGLEWELEEKYSDQFGVETKYLRKVYTAATKGNEGFGVPLVLPASPWVVDDMDVHIPASNAMGSMRSNASIVMKLSNRDELCLDELPVITDRDRKHLFAWMPPQAFRELSQPAGKHILRAWVDMLNRVDMDASLPGTDTDSRMCSPENSLSFIIKQPVGRHSLIFSNKFSASGIRTSDRPTTPLRTT